MGNTLRSSEVIPSVPNGRKIATNLLHACSGLIYPVTMVIAV